MVSYVLRVQNKLSKMAAPAEHRREAQVDQKRWYDHNARQREFQTGGMVMVLTAQLKGPYPILQKIRSANYMVDMRGRERTFHVNMLKSRTLPQRMFTLQQKRRKEKKHIPEWRGGGGGEPKMGIQLSDSQNVQTRELLDEFQEVMSSTPGRTSKAVHNISSWIRNPSNLLYIGFHMPIRS